MIWYPPPTHTQTIRPKVGLIFHQNVMDFLTKIFEGSQEGGGGALEHTKIFKIFV